MQFKYICFLSLIATGAALTCKMCDNYISCANEMSEQCPPHTQCYTIKRHGKGNDMTIGDGVRPRHQNGGKVSFVELSSRTHLSVEVHHASLP
ncbi:hypothetical protein ANCCAN_22944 [Ancylostoma caninum]|uniref:UPAR/Ly6 domain-containing protein n=1 Tax=Ancylostoma caninum TaxID=29170 RepID=A0A368FGA9_ANCCA|nr:hypothetical protein ANCCAN_22944 [Ancylostoma caninum]